MELIGKSESGVEDAVIARLPNARPTDHSMATSPEDEEIEKSMKGMKESSAGCDEVTINMIRMGGKEFKLVIYSLVRRLWEKPREWEE